MLTSLPSFDTTTAKLLGLVVLKLLVLLLILYIGYLVVRSTFTRVHNIRAARRNHCRPVARLPTWDPWFGLGLLRDFARTTTEHNGLEYMRRRYDETGNTFAFNMLTMSLITTREPENVKAVLAMKFEDYGVANLREIMIPFVGKGIFVSDGVAWKHSRDVLRPVFTRAQIADMGILKFHVERFLERIRFDGQKVDLQPLFFDLTLDVASHVIMGRSIGVQTQNEAGMVFQRAYDKCLDFFAGGGEGEMWGAVLPLPWDSPLKKQFKKDCEIINEYVKGIVEETMDRMRGDEEKGVETERYVLLEYLVQQGLSEEQVRAELLNTLLAGRDTTASMLSDLWFELSKNQRVFKKLHAEINQYVQDVEDIDYELIKTLPYLKATLNEILRIHPVVPENSKQAIQDTVLPLGGGKDELSPIFVPKGTLVSWSSYCMHRREDIWGPDVDEFRPERWIDEVDERGNQIKSVRPGWAYVPFNGGPRVCVGQQFALLNASYVTIRLMLSINGLESKDPLPWMEKVQLTATGFNGCKIGLVGKSK
jgi:cytochrome P450